MSRPFREYLEIIDGENGERIRCSCCHTDLCELGSDWRLKCNIKSSSPLEAGPLFEDLTRDFLLQRIYCPRCGVLYDATLVINKGSTSSGKETHG
jgi:acetone carboxylase gamma subunit